MIETMSAKYLSPSDKDKSFPQEYAEERLTHPHNKDLYLYYDPYFNEYPIMTHRGPQVFPYMLRLIKTVEDYFKNHSKVFAIRFELYFPHHWSLDERLNQQRHIDDMGYESIQPQVNFDKDYFSRFLASFKAQLSALENQDKKRGVYRKLDLSYARAIEMHEPIRDKRSKKRNRGLHIHGLFLLNGQRFESLGLYDTNQKQSALSANSLSTMIRKAWASALFGNTPNSQADRVLEPWQMAIPNYLALETVHDQGLVYFSGAWKPQSFPNEKIQQRQKIIFAASYLTKATTKAFGLNLQTFDCSHREKMNYKPYNENPSIYHLGNSKRPLYLKPEFQGVTLDATAQPYLENELLQLFNYFHQVYKEWSGVYAISLTLPVPLRVYHHRKQILYLKDAIGQLQYNLSPLKAKIASPENGLFLYAAYALKRNQHNEMSYQVVLFMHPRLYYDLFGSHQVYAKDYLMGWMCESFSRVYGISEHQVESELIINALFSVQVGDEHEAEEKTQLLKHLAMLASADDSFSFTSSLEFRYFDEQVKKYHFTQDYENEHRGDLQCDNQGILTIDQVDEDLPF